MTAMLTVAAAPVVGPELARREIELPEGLTLEEMVRQALPGLPAADWSNLRVYLIGPAGTDLVEQRYWSRLRPRPGIRIAVRLVPGKDALRSVLLTVISVAAIALGQVWAAALFPQGGIIGNIAAGLIAGGLTAVGSLLVNALIPARTRGNAATVDRPRDVYTISGWQNDLRPDAPVPMVLGRHRYAPPFAAPSYTEIVGDQQYVRAMFCFGYGPLDISELKLGETPLSEYDEVEIEVREGRPGDAPLSLYPRQVYEDAAGMELVRPLPRDASGQVIPGGASIETPVLRFTANDSVSASVILGFPSGLFTVDNNGNVGPRSASVRIRQRLEGVGAWSHVETIGVTANVREAFFRQHTWTLPSRGRWQIEITRLTDESTSTQVADRTVLSALQSVRPEYPIAIDKPLALVALRIKATYQLSGALDNFNALVQRAALDWNGLDWAESLTRNPAAAYVAALQGMATPFPASDPQIDWDTLADWHEWCEAKNLKYDRVHDEPESLGEVLSTICAAGRASPRHDGTKWSVVIDRQQPVAVDHINPRNYEAFTWSRGYFDPPDAFRVRFRDDSNDYNLAERIVPWPGHVGDIDLTEELVLPGKTDPDEIWIEARRRMYELLYRADRFSAVQDGSARVATRGDLVMASVDLLASTQRAARVVTVRDHLIEIDDQIEMSEGVAYAIRFRTYTDDEDSIGISVVREVVTDPGEQSILRLKSVADVPPVGRLIHFGPLASDSFALRVRGIEAGEDFSSILDMVADAPEIETLTDAEVPPAWNGRVGAEIGSGGIAPAAPRFVDVRTGTWGTGHPDGLDVIVAPGTGSAASVGSFEIDHKLTSAETWSMRSVPAAAAGTGLPGYSSGDQVDIRARAIATDGTIGPDSATLTVIIGAQDQPVPGALEASAITVTGGLGHALLSFATGADAELAQVQVYRVPSGATLDKAAHAVGSPFPVGTSSTVSYVDGDATRTSIVPNGSFDSTSDWSGTDWTITDGRAWHEPEETGTPFLASVSADDGATYRWSIDVAGRTDGVVQPWMVGDTTASHSTISADGTYRFTLTAPANVVSLGVGCTGAFDGAIDNVIAYRETVACIGEGSYDYYLEPQNDLGGAGPVAGPFPAVII